MTIYNALRGRTRYAGLVNTKLSSGVAYPAVVLAEPTLLHYFRMNEVSGSTLADSKGTLSLSTSGAVTIGQAGKLSDGKSVLFSGGYLQASAKLASYSKLTIELWAKVSATDNNRRAFYSDRGSGKPGTIFMSGPNIVGGGAGNNLSFEQDGDNVAFGRGATGQPINNNVWRHVVGVIDGIAGSHAVTDFRVYVDGSEALSYSNETHNNGYHWPANNSDAFKVGAAAIGATFYGYMCEYAIYSSALSADTIMAHYMAGSN